MHKMMDGCYKEMWFLHEEWGSNHEPTMVQQWRMAKPREIRGFENSKPKVWPTNNWHWIIKHGLCARAARGLGFNVAHHFQQILNFQALTSWVLKFVQNTHRCSGCSCAFGDLLGLCPSTLGHSLHLFILHLLCIVELSDRRQHLDLLKVNGELAQVRRSGTVNRWMLGMCGHFQVLCTVNMVSTGMSPCINSFQRFAKFMPSAFAFSQNLSMLQQKFGSLRETGGLAVLVARYLFMRLLCLWDTTLISSSDPGVSWILQSHFQQQRWLHTSLPYRDKQLDYLWLKQRFPYGGPNYFHVGVYIYIYIYL